MEIGFVSVVSLLGCFCLLCWVLFGDLSVCFVVGLYVFVIGWIYVPARFCLGCCLVIVVCWLAFCWYSVYNTPRHLSKMSSKAQ